MTGSNLPPRYVSYVRCSTRRQEQSGLGLDVQRESVAAYVRQQGGTIVSEFREVESGRKANRPQLAAALQAARVHRAVLVIAKIDRLARNVHVVSGLLESGVEFIAADMPTVNRLTIHILAAVAEEEARAISARTKAALRAARARGVQLGGDRGYRPPAPPPAGLGATAQRQQADDRARDLFRQVAAIRRHLVNPSLRRIIEVLEAENISTARGGVWTPTTLSRALKRAEVLGEAA